MDDRATRIFGLMYGAYNLDNCNIEESEVVKNEFLSGFCRAESDMGYAARVRILDRLSDGKDDEDVDILVDTNYNIEEYLAYKMYDYAKYYTKLDILYDIFDLIWNYRNMANMSGDLAEVTKYTYDANGLMMAAVLVIQKELEEVEEMYKNYIAERKNIKTI